MRQNIVCIEHHVFLAKKIEKAIEDARNMLVKYSEKSMKIDRVTTE
jgi:hypothetical protein